MHREAKRMPILQNIVLFIVPIVLFLGLVYVLALVSQVSQNKVVDIVGISLIPMLVALIVGYLFAKKTYISAFSAGMISGLVLLLLMITVGGFLFDELPNLLHVALMAGKIIPATVLGAIFGISSRPRKRK